MISDWNAAVNATRNKYGYIGRCVKGTEFHNAATCILQRGKGSQKKPCLCCNKVLCTCITRKQTHIKGPWIYMDSKGVPIKEGDIIKRLNKIGMPPAYVNVRLNSNPNAARQGVGQDKKGKWQYRYSSDHVVRTRNKKFARMRQFMLHIPAIRRMYRSMIADTSNKDKQRTGLALYLIDECSLRPGSPDYMRKNNTHGASTLLRKHLHKADHNTYRAVIFPGKRGKRTTCVVSKKMYEYLDGLLRNQKSLTTPELVNQSLPKDFVAKDFRTYGANVAFIREACAKPNAHVSAYLKASAKQLNNTPAICRRSYIDPGLFNWAKNKPLLFPSAKMPRKCTEAESLLRIVLNDI